MINYNHSEFEKKWQEFWETQGTFHAQEDDERLKYYCLVMFPYPSGKLHMGHVRNYVLGDIFARYYRMKGFNVIQPIGWDSFGLPAENAAIKNKVNPRDWTRQNIAHMRMQLKSLGISYDWRREIATCEPDYYKWNQWFFIKMWEKGLAYRKTSKVNWCPSCATVLANEQVHSGKCWRCDSLVENKELEQWFIKITDYAQELLDGHEKLKDGWPEEVLAMQKHWIGKSIGGEVDFKIVSDSGHYNASLKVFTTRPDTLFGATFIVVAPEHGMLSSIEAHAANYQAVKKYVDNAIKQKASTAKEQAIKEKTGVRLEGVSAVNPANGSKLPVYVSDYVLMEYGTGAIMAVPAHDQRDWDFATAHNIPIIQVIGSEGLDIQQSAWEGDGVMMNSAQFNGLPVEEGKIRILDWLQEKGVATRSTKFRIKDWLVSRQRFWGTPIPMIHCPACGIVPVPENQLPVTLPDNVVLTGTGQSPLSEDKAFTDVTCPKCGGPAKRETDTMDTFVDSSWYYARYCDPKNARAPFARDNAAKWLPVDQYIGGIEHACMHLIYARFWHKLMRDLGLVKSDEPFMKLLTQGMVCLGGSAMSKSRGNIVTPDEILANFGADTARLFIMFAAPPHKQLEWSSDGVEGSWRFINRFWRLLERLEVPGGQATDAESAELRKVLHATIKKVTNDIEKEQQLNTAISSVMELVNALYAYPAQGNEVFRETLKTITLLLAPYIPHTCEEMWQLLGNKNSISTAPWPQFDPQFLVEDTIELPVQINGKLRGRLCVPLAVTEQELRTLTIADKSLEPFLGGKAIKKFIYVPKKILNIVV